MSSKSDTAAPVYQSAQFAHENVRALPKGSVLLGILKTIESELRNRSMLGETSEALTPIWFLAETERNIFLWRNGKSLDDQCEFEFWIHVPALLEKRRGQLRKPSGLNPFVNPLWGTAPFSPEQLAREEQYLDEFEALAESILPHAEALSHASRAIREELGSVEPERMRVLLPCSFEQSRM